MAPPAQDTQAFSHQDCLEHPPGRLSRERGQVLTPRTIQPDLSQDSPC